MAPANGVAAAASHRQRQAQKCAAYRLRPMYSSQNGAMSQVFMTSRPPRLIAARACVNGERRVAPRLRTCAAAVANTSSSKGMATKCGWRSLSRAVKNGNSLMPSGCALGTTREEANHHSPFAGGHWPGVMPSPKFLMPSTPPAAGGIAPRETRYSKNARRLPQYRPRRVATLAPAAAQRPGTPAARASVHTSDASPIVARAGTVAAARLYATLGSAASRLPRDAATK